jgi:hypothetical protein
MGVCRVQPTQEVILHDKHRDNVHRKRCLAALKDEEGRLLEELAFENRSEGVDRLLEKG